MSSTKKLVIISTVLVAAFGIFGSVSLSRRPQEVRVQVTRKDKTTALTVEKVEVLPQAVKVFIKNTSVKAIDGIQLSVNGGHLQIDFLGADEESYQRVLPGAAYELFLSRDVVAQPLEVTLLAVTFTDKSSDGDPELAKQIFDTRRGFNKQMKRIRPLLDAALNSSDADPIRILDKFKSQVEGLRIEESADSRAMKEGRSEARAEVLNQIQFFKERQLATGALPYQRALAKMKDRHQKRIQYGPE